MDLSIITALDKVICKFPSKHKMLLVGSLHIENQSEKYLFEVKIKLVVTNTMSTGPGQTCVVSCELVQ